MIKNSESQQIKLDTSSRKTKKGHKSVFDRLTDGGPNLKSIRSLNQKPKSPPRRSPKEVLIAHKNRKSEGQVGIRQKLPPTFAKESPRETYENSSYLPRADKKTTILPSIAKSNKNLSKNNFG
ncbi:unnamed protein product [Moneuplotes crassus]|uniref:Uncharacterized protein n=1 Tax=Euplotes crassus TaxID=5936 RepID=A0AAD2D7R7_EUPCR|nr:unnamed protein product [Moneuplotes crassus]